MILKSYLVEQDISILDRYQSILLYGENEGIKEDIKNRLKELNKGAEVINFFETEILKNKNLIHDNVVNKSLFNEKKLIFIQSATDKILNEITECLKRIDQNTKIIILSENLDKKAKLRSLFEKEKTIAIFPCYVDNERTLIGYINKELNGFKGLTGELLNLIITNSNSNRKIVKSEIVKIKTYFLQKIINKNELLEILNVKSDSGFDEIRDNALMGRIEKINKLLSEINILNEDSFFYLNNLNYRILRLIEIQKKSDTINDCEKTMENLKPPIFWKDKPIYLQQLKKWSLEKLNSASFKIGEIEILMKKNSYIRNDVVIKNLVVTLSKEASTS